MIISTIFAPELVSDERILSFGLKGNRVQIPDSPAAVKLHNFLINTLATGREL